MSRLLSGIRGYIIHVFTGDHPCGRRSTIIHRGDAATSGSSSLGYCGVVLFRYIVVSIRLSRLSTIPSPYETSTLFCPSVFERKAVPTIPSMLGTAAVNVLVCSSLCSCSEDVTAPRPRESKVIQNGFTSSAIGNINSRSRLLLHRLGINIWSQFHSSWTRSAGDLRLLS